MAIAVTPNHFASSLPRDSILGRVTYRTKARDDYPTLKVNVKFGYCLGKRKEH